MKCIKIPKKPTNFSTDNYCLDGEIRLNKLIPFINIEMKTHT